MSIITLLGAGGKMGIRLGMNLKQAGATVRHVEVSPAGQERVRSILGYDVIDAKDALRGADTVILAVPDTLIGKIATSIVGDLSPGTMVVILDAAAPQAGHLPKRDDITYFVTHPCHPPIFNDEITPAAKQDFFGGIAAKQHVVCALMQGPEEHYAEGEVIARMIWAPVMNCYRISVDQMAMLEPGLSETLCASLLDVMREALDEVVRRGVPREAARAFLLGHMNVSAQ